MPPSTETLEAKLDGFRELVEAKFGQLLEHHERIDEHLTQLNGQVAKNSNFRLRAKVYAGVLLGALTFIVPVIQAVIRDTIISRL